MAGGERQVSPRARARTAQDRRALVVAALQSDRPLAEVAEANELTAASLRRLIRQELAARLPQTAGSLASPTGRPIEIVRDQHGVPHVFAESETDAYAGLGFVVAQDRLWQLEYRRRWAYGTLAEVLGPGGVANDKAARTLQFHKLAEAEHAEHPPETRAALEAYAAGVNAAVAGFGDRLPIEFEVLGIPFAPWRAVDTVTIARASLWQFSGRIENIVIGEAAERLLPAELAARFLSVEAPYESIVPGHPDGSPGTFPVPPSKRGGDGPDASAEPLGSNQWAVGPGLSARGAPLLASDGHVPYYQPSTRYEIHLVGGRLDAIGIADAGVPTLQNGRSRGVAWGLTNNVSSNRDLYAEELNPANPDEVRDGDGWAALSRREETINVRGADSIRLTIRSSPRGPLVNHLVPSVDLAGDPPLALRWVGLDPRDCITGGLDLNAAQTAAEARETHRVWQFSGQNPGFADTAGHIGFQMRGRMPVRGRTVRGYRSPANPDDAWQEPVPFDALPAEADPPRGWIASANQRPHPVGSAYPLAGAYGDGYRGRRIRALLTEGETVKAPFTLADMGTMHQDVYSERAAELKAALADLLAGAPSGDDARANVSADLPRVARLLRRWDSRYTVGSVAASLFATFWWRWCARVAAARFPAHLHAPMAGAAGAVAHDLLLDGDFGWFEGEDDVQREARAAMSDALGWLREHLGDDWQQWAWGRLHPLKLTHALSAGRPVFAELFDIGPRPCPGGVGVLNQNSYAIRDRFWTTGGPHYRFLADLAETNQAQGVNTAGNAGNPASPHYADQFPDWLAGRYHPLWMDRADIEAHAEATLRLTPTT